MLGTVGTEGEKYNSEQMRKSLLMIILYYLWLLLPLINSTYVKYFFTL